MGSSQINNRKLIRLFAPEAWAGILLLSMAYYVAGLIGIRLESAQTGISLIWPASGLALAAFILYGIHLWPAIYIAIIALAITVGLPVWLALIAATGNILEALIPLLIARRYGFTGSLHSLRQLLMFIAISGAGPLISASIGLVAFSLSTETFPVPAQNLFLTWWLGNSLGILLIGSAILLTHECINQQNCREIKPLGLTGLITASILISWGAFHDVSSLQSPLILNLMIPLVILSSVYYGYRGTLLPVIIATSIMILLSSYYSPEALNQYPLGVLFLDVVELWIITLTGLLISAAQHEGIKHMKVNWLVTHDGLTSLKNRHYLELKLDKLIFGLRQKDNAFSLLFLDLNDFKRVNDSAGHLTGDACLAHVAKILTETTRETDTVARWGGDEFIILLPDCPIETAHTIANNINKTLNDKPFIHNDFSFNISFSIGLTTAISGDTSAQIIDRADKASYKAKQHGEELYRSDDINLSTTP